MKLKRIIVAPILAGALLTGCGRSSKDSQSESKSSFLIQAKDEGASLVLSNNSDFKQSSRRLAVNNIPEFTGAFTYQWFLNSTKDYTLDKVHNEKTDYNVGYSSTYKGLLLLKHTFFVKNTGESNLAFHMDIELLNQNSNLLEYLRLAVFEDTIAPVVYARRSKARYDASNEVYKEYISGPEGTVNYFGEAELFETDNLLTMINANLNPNESKKYTLAFWLEGEDNECKDVPDEAYLNIKVSIG